MKIQKENQSNFLNSQKPKVWDFSVFRKFGTKGFLISGIVLVAAASAVFFVHKKSEKVSSATVAVPQIDQSEIPAWWYKQYFDSSVCDQDSDNWRVCDPNADPDHDGLTNKQEFYYHTDPQNPKTIGDKLNDGQLVAEGIDPSSKDKKTFDQATDQDSILGDSLVFGKDIKQMVADDFDISKVTLPEVENDQLSIIYTDDAKTYNNYNSTLQSTIYKYFSQADVPAIENILKTGSDADVRDFQFKAAKLSDELKTIPVPLRFLAFHKDNIMLFKLLSEIVPAPIDPNSTESEEWFDHVQQFMAVQQKLEFEEQALKLQQ